MHPDRMLYNTFEIAIVNWLIGPMFRKRLNKLLTIKKKWNVFRVQCGIWCMRFTFSLSLSLAITVFFCRFSFCSFTITMWVLRLFLRLKVLHRFCFFFLFSKIEKTLEFSSERIRCVCMFMWSVAVKENAIFSTYVHVLFHSSFVVIKLFICVMNVIDSIMPRKRCYPAL